MNYFASKPFPSYFSSDQNTLLLTRQRQVRESNMQHKVLYKEREWQACYFGGKTRSEMEMLIKGITRRRGSVSTPETGQGNGNHVPYICICTSFNPLSQPMPWPCSLRQAPPLHSHSTTPRTLLYLLTWSLLPKILYLIGLLCVLSANLNC